jgi:threonylcarbamoyladenosine tRNA methylthiotransferase MtaB
VPALLAGARAAAEGGCGEIVLTGIDLGAWRDGELRLPGLVTRLAGLPGLARLRLSSLEPRHLDARLLEALAHARVARHLHVPLQSGDDGVLAAMARPYTVDGYLARVVAARERLPGLLLSTDVIVGYPTEDETAFARTLALIDEDVFGRVHVFAYSPREGTPAAALSPLPAPVVKERMGRALAAAQAAASRARRAALGVPAEVLVEDERDGLLRGYSSQYIRYHVAGDAAPGTIVRAVAECEHRDGVRGRIE